MTKVIIHGCGGRMGKALERIINDMPKITICAGVDPMPVENKYPVFGNISECDGIEADVIIDFSTASAVDGMLKYAVKRGIGVVLCTTGLSEDTLKLVSEAKESIPVLRSANMSLGVNLILELVAQAAKVLYPAGFDIELVERHHNQKADAPSGTALALADSVNNALDNQLEYIYDRTGRRQARERKELGIHAVRGGSIPGDHDVIFAGKDEIVTISHNALSRDIFAQGAVKAAVYLKGKKPGLYSMKDVVLD